jgi:hypothetical protein
MRVACAGKACACAVSTKLRIPGLWHAPVRERADSSTDRKVVFA